MSSSVDPLLPIGTNSRTDFVTEIAKRLLSICIDRCQFGLSLWTSPIFLLKTLRRVIKKKTPEISVATKWRTDEIKTNQKLRKKRAKQKQIVELFICGGATVSDQHIGEDVEQVDCIKYKFRTRKSMTSIGSSSSVSTWNEEIEQKKVAVTSWHRHASKSIISHDSSSLMITITSKSLGSAVLDDLSEQQTVGMAANLFSWLNINFRNLVA